MGQARNMTDAKAIKMSDCSRGVAGSRAGTVRGHVGLLAVPAQLLPR